MRAYTVAEVMGLGFKARHEAEDGVVYSWSGGFAVRTDPLSGVSVLITNRYHGHCGRCLRFVISTLTPLSGSMRTAKPPLQE